MSDQPDHGADSAGRDERGSLTALVIHAVRAEGLTPGNMGSAGQWGTVTNALLNTGWTPPEHRPTVCPECGVAPYVLHLTTCVFWPDRKPTEPVPGDGTARDEGSS